MTISSSLNASVAGLNANASRLATISDNIANASTFGYKRAVTDFHSMVIESGRGRYAAGGVRTTSTRLIDERGSFVSTTNPTDLAVRGNGMLPVTSLAELNVENGGTNIMLGTTGSFRPDNQGYLRSPSGLVLMGWPADANGTIPAFPRDSIEGLEPIKINTNSFSGEPTTELGLAINLPATGSEAGASGDPELLSIEYYDNLGNSETLELTFTPTVPATGASNEWLMTITDTAAGITVVGEYTIVFDDTRGAGGTMLSVTPISGGAYDPVEGTVVVNVDSGPLEITLGEIGAPNGMTQLSDSFAPVAIDKNGTPIGSMTGIEVDSNGYVIASYDTGSSRVLYQVPLVAVPNVNGMETLDRQSYWVTPESGTFFLWDAGDGPTGEIASYVREESTTDVAGELTQLIQTQRAYSSNAKVIQTVDEMLQETTNIKR